MLSLHLLRRQIVSVMPDTDGAVSSLSPRLELIMNFSSVGHVHTVAEQPDLVEDAVDGTVLFRVVKTTMKIIGLSLPNGFSQTWPVLGKELFVGVQLKDPVARGIGERLIAVFAEVIFPGMMIYSGAVVFCDLDSPIR